MVKQRLGLPALAVVLAVSVPGTAPASPFTFSDDFTPSPSADWSNTAWTDIAPGDYAAVAPNNIPPNFTYLPFDLTNDDLQITVTANHVGDGGIVLNSGDVVLVLGGAGYGSGARGGAAGTGAYWAVTGVGGALDYNMTAFTPGDTYTITVTVNGDTYTAYDDPDGILDGNSTVLTTLVSDAFSGGEVGLYDDQPNTTTGAGFGPALSFSDFSLQQGPRGVPEPASLGMFGAALIGLGAMRRRKRNAA